MFRRSRINQIHNLPGRRFLYNHLSGMEYLTMVAQLRGLRARESANRIERLLQVH